MREARRRRREPTSDDSTMDPGGRKTHVQVSQTTGDRGSPQSKCSFDNAARGVFSDFISNPLN